MGGGSGSGRAGGIAPSGGPRLVLVRLPIERGCSNLVSWKRGRAFGLGAACLSLASRALFCFQDLVDFPREFEFTSRNPQYPGLLCFAEDLI